MYFVLYQLIRLTLPVPFLPSIDPGLNPSLPFPPLPCVTHLKRRSSFPFLLTFKS